MKFMFNRIPRLATMAAAAMLLTTVAHAAVTLTDIGATAPTPGANDISQLIDSFPLGSGGPPGLNYYWDDGAGHPTVGYPGQTFTTLGNPQGYTLTSVAIQTGGNGGGNQFQSQSFTLNIYQLSGSTATLLNNFTATGQLVAEGDWMQWNGLGVTLSPNSTYAFGFGRSPGSPGDWELISTATNLPYAGGQSCLVPNAGGTVTFSSSPNNYDMTFDLGLTLPAAPIANPPVENPSYANLGILAGSNVTMTASAAGSTPIFWQWQTDGGSGGSLTNIPGATNVTLVVNTAGFTPGAYQYSFVASNSLGAVSSPTAAITIASVFMADIGTNTPTPGPLDISQLLNTSQNNDGLNYYTDNGANNNSWPGQTFTTGTNASGYVLTSLTWKSGGANRTSSAFNTIQLYNLYIYALTGGGATASRFASYQAYGGGTDNDWFKWVGLNTPLAPNTQYAYAFGRDGTAAGWEQVGNQSGNPYAGGQIAFIPSAGGTVTYGNTGNSDAAFDLGLILAQAPSANPPTYTPTVNPLYAGTLVTFQEAAVGPPPLRYQWLADNGTGTLSPVGGANGTNLVVDTTAFAPNNYQYAVIVTNAFGAATSAVVTLNVAAASAPILVTDTTPSNVLAYAGANLTFNAAFQGTLPITNQWLVNTGGGNTSILNATNTTLVLTNLQAANVGSYTLAATNSVGAGSSTPSTLALLPTPPAPAPGSYAAAVLSDTALAYWRLGETNDPALNYLMTYDATGNHFMGVYGIGVLNPANFATPGPQSPAFPGFEASNNGIELVNGQANNQVIIPPLNLNTNSVTITAWINPAGAEGTFWGLFMNRNGADAAGLGFGGNVDGTGMAELGYTWNTNSSATWGFHSGLFPPAGVWSLAALTITPSNATLNLCYVNGGATNVLAAVNPIAHNPEGFTGGTTWLGSDPAGGAAGRTFTGFIDEVAVFNHALSQGQIVALFAKGIGAGAIAPAIAAPPASQTLFAGQPATWTVAGGGSTPLTYQWQAGVTGSGVFSNLVDGGAISGSSSGTLTVNPATAATAADYRMILANSAGSVTSGVATLTILPVPAGQWVVNFQVTNNINGSPGLYTGPGVLWNGTAAPRTNWNPIADTLGSMVTGTFSSTSDLQDNGTVHSGISATIFNSGGGYSGGGGGANNPLLSTYVLVVTNPPATLQFTGVPPGIYNLALYGVDGSFHDRGIIFTVGNLTNTLVNTQDSYFSPGDNTAIFQNVPILNGTLNVSMMADPLVHPPDFNEGDFNAAQIQLVTPAPVLTNTWTGSALNLSWPAGSILLESTNVTGPWTTNNASSPLSVSPTLPKKFYRLQMPY